MPPIHTPRTVPASDTRGEARSAPGSGIETVDSENRLVAVLQPDVIRKQSLFHRAVALLLCEQEHRVRLVRLPPDAPFYPNRWDVSGHSPLHFGQSILQTGLALAADLAPLVSPLRTSVLDTVLAPQAMTGFAFTSLVRSVFPVDDSAAAFTRETMPVDREELSYLLMEYRDRFTPLVTLCWERNLLFP